MPKPRILMVEDEESISEPVAAALEREGFVSDVAATAAQASRDSEPARPTWCCST